jgi:hypothetical protein
MSPERAILRQRREARFVLMDEPHGLPLRFDPDAESASADEPAFIARPPGAPVYYGFPILDDVEVDGFRLGMISDWEAEPSDYGDAFIVAPDDSRCGLVWEVGHGAYVDPACDGHTRERATEPPLRAGAAAAEVGGVEAVGQALTAQPPRGAAFANVPRRSAFGAWWPGLSSYCVRHPIEGKQARATDQGITYCL